MTPDSLLLGWQTDLIFARFDGEIVDRGDHLLVRTPANPTFWWGNFLLFEQAPSTGDLQRWMALFEDQILLHQPESRHRAFGVDPGRPFALPDDFIAAGFTSTEATVLTLTADQLHAPAKILPNGVEFAVLDLPTDAEAVVGKHVAVEAGGFEAVAHRLFVQRQMARCGAMQAAGLGHWFGLWADAAAASDESATPGALAGQRTLVASCGLFRDPARGDGLGRFQFVSTHPRRRRRGLCTALVHATCRFGFDTMGLRTLVMVADPADVAIGLYESLGFQRGGSTWQIERAPD